MAVRLRLMRTGKKKQPSYRVVAADTRSPRDGRFIEIVGTYNPRTEPSEITINKSRVVHWLSVGAQPSERVQKLLEITGTMDDFKAGKTPEELAEAAEAEKAAAVAAAEAEAAAAAPVSADA